MRNQTAGEVNTDTTSLGNEPDKLFGHEIPEARQLYYISLSPLRRQRTKRFHLQQESFLLEHTVARFMSNTK
jgi:hypothetical protein